MNINPSWNYKEVSRNLKALRHEYESVLTSFSYICDENTFILETRNQIYALPIEEFEKDRVWEYMNGDLSAIDAIILFRIWD